MWNFTFLMMLFVGFNGFSQKFTKEETIKVGKWTMISSIIPFILAAIVLQ